MKILLTGGAGYIGSHTYIALCAAGHEAVILDDFSNSHPAVLARLQEITGTPVALAQGDVTDRNFVAATIDQHQVEAAIHFAAFKAVGESVARPLPYYRNNLGGLISLLEAMDQAGCKKLVYSSSATVYGDPATVPITESFPRSFTNPYGHTKLVGEDVLSALRKTDPAWRIATLRYFNPVGAHDSGLIGEDPNGIPNNLMPFITQVAVGKREFLNIFGSDYPTPDGTGVRDYIHVMDLAEGHVAALDALADGSFTVNLGTGQGYSVLEMVKAFEAASGRPIPYRLAPRREGDIAACYADPSLAAARLGWRARRGLAEMCASSWKWQSTNPHGFRGDGEH